MCGCACHLSAALRLSDSCLWDGSGRQWRQRATRLRPTCDYCGDGARRVRTRCKQHTEPQTTFSGWNTSVRSGWPGTDAEWLMSDQRRGQVPHEPGEDAWNQIYRLAFALLSLSLGPERRFTRPVWQSTPRPAKQIKQLPQARGALEHVLVPRGPSLSGNMLKIDWCSLTIWSCLNNIKTLKKKQLH